MTVPAGPAAVAWHERHRIRALLPALALLLVMALLFIISAVSALTVGTQQAGAFQPSQVAVADIPANYLQLYLAAGRQYGIDWAILAAIGKIETNHGRSTAPGVHSGVNGFGCCAGPMQFSVSGHPSTWDVYGQGGDVYDPGAAIPAAARYLSASGAPGDYRRAILAYNHADWYVAEVMAKANEYRGALQASGDVGGYVNPFRDPGWVPSRTDQGVDWVPTRPLPVRAVGDCVITYSSTSSGWPGGAFVAYRLLSGAAAGLYVYDAEHLRGLPRVGRRFRAGQRIATALPGSPWLETGWAAPAGPTPATPYGGAPDGTPMPGGKAFARFLRQLGAEPLQDPGPGPTRP